MIEDPNVERLIKEAIKPLEKTINSLDKIMKDSDIKPLSFKKSQMNKLLKPIEDFISNLEQTRFLDKYDSSSQAFLDMQLKNTKRSISLLKGENPDDLKTDSDSLIKRIIFNERDLLKDFIEVHFDTRIKNLIKRLCIKNKYNFNDVSIVVFCSNELKEWKLPLNFSVKTAKEINNKFQKYVVKS